MDEYTISYAQNREDLILAAFFPNDFEGFYVDVGANHPTHESVTKHFYERGWTGINIEPIRRLHSLLETDRPKDKNLNVGIGSKESTLTLREYINGDGLSTFSEEMKLQYEKETDWFSSSYEDYEVEIKSLKSVLETYAKNKTINFLKVDVEGFEYDVLLSNDWKKNRPQVICIESNHIFNEWSSILVRENYENVFNDGINDYYCDKKAVSLRDEFDYAKKLIVRPKRIINWYVYLKLASEKRSLKYIDYLLAESNNNENLNQQAFQASTKKLFFTSLIRINNKLKGKIEKLNSKKEYSTDKNNQSVVDDINDRYRYYSRNKPAYLLFSIIYNAILTLSKKVFKSRVI